MLSRPPWTWLCLSTGFLIAALAISQVAVAQPELELEHPFPRRIAVPEFPEGMEWLNVSGPLRMQDLRGKFVLLDFWTYCCINCIHILPELKALEHAYGEELVVVGVHSAKFEAEKVRKNIEEAILRYEIEHPVINDHEHQVWRMFGARSWPTILLVDPEGNAVWGRSGEIQFEEVDIVLQHGMEYYEKRKTLDRTPLRFDLLAHRVERTPLRFPGKVLADEAGGRLFIADSNHNRIVVTSLNGELQTIIGDGQMGRQDGSFEEAQFDHPQGMALRDEMLYVADTENHLLRQVDLTKRQVRTVAGTGEQNRRPWPGIDELGPSDPLPERWVGPPARTALSSPWAIWIQEDQLYIAMAGPHQIWKMPLDESEVGPYAGNGREDIVDGPLLPRLPYEEGFSSFAQPSGLASDGTWLYVADSEGSSIRAVPFDPTQEVRTVVGTNEIPQGRLFTFGDRDGQREQVLLQHVLGVVWHDGVLFIADTYNNKIKTVDPISGATLTIAGTGSAGAGDEPAEFDEPAGISYAGGNLYVADTNNHAIRVIDLATMKVATLSIEGLQHPQPSQTAAPDFRDAKIIQLDRQVRQARDGTITFVVELELPLGWKLNPLAPAEFWLSADDAAGAVDRQALGKRELATPQKSFQVELPVNQEGDDLVHLSMDYYYCQEGNEGLCKVGSVVWKVPLNISKAGEDTPVELRHRQSWAGAAFD